MWTGFGLAFTSVSMKIMFFMQMVAKHMDLPGLAPAAEDNSIFGDSTLGVSNTWMVNMYIVHYSLNMFHGCFFNLVIREPVALGLVSTVSLISLEVSTNMLLLGNAYVVGAIEKLKSEIAVWQGTSLNLTRSFVSTDFVFFSRNLVLVLWLVSFLCTV